jgi:hypothetical protein
MRLSRYETAIRRWVDALNEGGARVRVETAVHPEVRVARFGFGENAGVLMEEILGVEGVSAWFGLTPKELTFEIASEVELESRVPSEISRAEEGADGESIAQVRYRVFTEGFSNGGTWRFTLSDDDLITSLEHHPDDLAGEIYEEASKGNDRNEQHDDPHHLEHHHGN